ncbi:MULTISPECIES: hypothetical protein [Bradyrhizobium]|uniref:hypothetical protein n=1 Tax=Bradyrhizobium embrapense TaxID=630921 RepID=UPI00067CD936|nr:hypothetical protein [Bradyrhizobium embrapense]
MQRNTKILTLAAVSLIATTAGAFAQGYYPYGSPGTRYYGGPRYGAQPYVMYQPAEPGWYGYGPMNGANHPAPSSTQGDVGPEGNNNGTLTGVYRQW